MKAIKVTEPYKIEVVDVDMPAIENDDEIIIKVISAGICGSDIGIYKGTNSLATYPRIIGHEFGGTVTEIGRNVKDIRVGDHVAVDPVISCGKCYACRIGRNNVCSDLEVLGVHRDGGFSQFIKVDAKNAHKVSPKISSDVLSVIEPYSVGMEINHRAQISYGDTVLIMGAGPIGICTMQIAKIHGAKVIMTDIIETRLRKAEKLGADVAILIGKEILTERISKLTGNEGVPVIVDTVCTPASFEQCVDLSCPAGRIAVIGLEKNPSRIAMADITKKELTIIGSRLNCNCFGDVISLVEDGSIHPEQLITGKYGYMDIQKAFDRIIRDPSGELKVSILF